MYARLIFLTSFAMYFSPVSAQIFKCTDSAGKVAYSETPCKGSGKRLGVDRVGANEVRGDQKRVSEMSREADVLSRENEIENIEAEIRGYRRSMDSELSALRTKKTYALNNLAGATWETSISQEMEAVMKKYEVMINDASRRLVQAKESLATAKKTKSPERQAE